jgi:phosphonate transport system permease protein
MASVATPTAVAQREWRRFTPAQRLGRFAIYLLLVLAIVASLRTIEIIPEFLYDAPDQVVDLLTRMWPIAWEHYPTGVHAALVETLHIASLGTLLALLLATPVGILAANRLVPSALLNWLARLILVSSRLGPNGQKKIGGSVGTSPKGPPDQQVGCAPILRLIPLDGVIFTYRHVHV